MMYRFREKMLEVFLIHPGGPFWARKDEGAWSIPKGEFGPGEDPEAAARREFHEETGLTPSRELTPLEPVRQKGGKTVLAWAFAGDADPGTMRSNTFSVEWPPHSGKRESFPEADRAAWFGLEAARRKINPAQAAFLDQLARLLGAES